MKRGVLHQRTSLHETPAEIPAKVSRDISLRDCVATLNDDLYYKIWDMYLSLETNEAKALCFQKAHEAYETAGYNERSGWQTILLIDLDAKCT